MFGCLTEYCFVSRDLRPNSPVKPLDVVQRCAYRDNRLHWPFQPRQAQLKLYRSIVLANCHVGRVHEQNKRLAHCLNVAVTHLCLRSRPALHSSMFPPNFAIAAAEYPVHARLRGTGVLIACGHTIPGSTGQPLLRIATQKASPTIGSQASKSISTNRERVAGELNAHPPVTFRPLCLIL